jgi:hypothetical protein
LVLLDREQACVNAVTDTLEFADEPVAAELAELAEPVATALVDLVDPIIQSAEQVFTGVNVLLCKWHMNKDVFAYARARCKELGRRELYQDEVINGKLRKKGEIVDTNKTDEFASLYYATLSSATVTEFEENCARIHALSPTMAVYLQRNWWLYKEKIVRCWTSQFTSFGLTTTSIVEGTHAKLKQWLYNS